MYMHITDGARIMRRPVQYIPNVTQSMHMSLKSMISNS